MIDYTDPSLQFFFIVNIVYTIFKQFVSQKKRKNKKANDQISYIKPQLIMFIIILSSTQTVLIAIVNITKKKSKLGWKFMTIFQSQIHA